MVCCPGLVHQNRLDALAPEPGAWFETDHFGLDRVDSWLHWPAFLAEAPPVVCAAGAGVLWPRPVAPSAGAFRFRAGGSRHFRPDCSRSHLDRTHSTGGE